MRCKSQCRTCKNCDFLCWTKMESEGSSVFVHTSYRKKAKTVSVKKITAKRASYLVTCGIFEAVFSSLYFTFCVKCFSTPY